MNIQKQDQSVSVLLLNNQDGINKNIFHQDWKRATKRYCADGALHLLKSMHITPPPDYLIGDMDSVSERDLHDFEASGHGKVVRMESQDETDFEKSVKVYRDTRGDQNEWLLVYGAVGGERLDHTMAAFHPLICGDDLRVKLVVGKGIAFVIPTGDHMLTIDKQLVGAQCGLFPVAGATMLSTTGFKWDLSNQTLQYGQLISVSNVIDSDTVTISTATSPIIMTVQMAK